MVDALKSRGILGTMERTLSFPTHGGAAQQEKLELVILQENRQCKARSLPASLQILKYRSWGGCSVVHPFETAVIEALVTQRCLVAMVQSDSPMVEQLVDSCSPTGSVALLRPTEPSTSLTTPHYIFFPWETSGFREVFYYVNKAMPSVGANTFEGFLLVGLNLIPPDELCDAPTLESAVGVETDAGTSMSLDTYQAPVAHDTSPAQPQLVLTTTSEAQDMQVAASPPPPPPPEPVPVITEDGRRLSGGHWVTAAAGVDRSTSPPKIGFGASPVPEQPPPPPPPVSSSYAVHTDMATTTNSQIAGMQSFAPSPTTATPASAPPPPPPPPAIEAVTADVLYSPSPTESATIEPRPSSGFRSALPSAAGETTTTINHEDNERMTTTITTATTSNNNSQRTTRNNTTATVDPVNTGSLKRARSHSRSRSYCSRSLSVSPSRGRSLSRSLSRSASRAPMDVHAPRHGHERRRAGPPHREEQEQRRNSRSKRQAVGPPPPHNGEQQGGRRKVCPEGRRCLLRENGRCRFMHPGSPDFVPFKPCKFGTDCRRWREGICTYRHDPLTPEHDRHAHATVHDHHMNGGGGGPGRPPHKHVYESPIRSPDRRMRHRSPSPARGGGGGGGGGHRDSRDAHRASGRHERDLSPYSDEGYENGGGDYHSPVRRHNSSKEKNGNAANREDRSPNVRRGNKSCCWGNKCFGRPPPEGSGKCIHLHPGDAAYQPTIECNFGIDCKKRRDKQCIFVHPDELARGADPANSCKFGEHCREWADGKCERLHPGQRGYVPAHMMPCPRANQCKFLREGRPCYYRHDPSDMNRDRWSPRARETRPVARSRSRSRSDSLSSYSSRSRSRSRSKGGAKYNDTHYDRDREYSSRSSSPRSMSYERSRSPYVQRGADRRGRR